MLFIAGCCCRATPTALEGWKSAATLTTDTYTLAPLDLFFLIIPCRTQRAYRLADSLIGLYKSPRRFMKLRRSFDAWMRGIQEAIPGYRLHQFVRAAEGLTKPRRGRISNDFEDRCQLFIGRGVRNKAALRQLYDLRSCFEHIKPWRSELRKVRRLDVAESLLFRTLQAELVASWAFCRILQSQTLLRNFASDNSIEQFWAMPEPEKKKAWGKPAPFTAEAASSYIWLYE